MKFFIEHPVIAIILNVMILIVGLLCLNTLTVREYPDVEMPVLAVFTSYPNASPELIETAITNILEDRLAGVPGITSISSESRQNSSYISLKFEEGTSMDRAMIMVRDEVEIAKANLPKKAFAPVVQRLSKSDKMPFIMIALDSDVMEFGEFTHYANLYLKNALRSVAGVGSVEVWGQPYTMMVTLDPKRLYAFGVNADEVYNAIDNNNVSWPVGSFKDKIPTTLDQTLSTVYDFENIMIKESKKRPIFLKSVADIALKTDNKDVRVHINGKTGIALAVYQTSDANPLEVSKNVRAQIDTLQKTLPQDIKLNIVLDQSDFIRASLHNIKSSIFETVLLVIAIVFFFLRNLRATLIPLVTIPISLIGSAIFLKICGFSINTFTLLAMVLAIGLVVDDAIVVLENISRHLENGLSRTQAAIKGISEIGFAIIAMTLTLASVYAPIAFIEGMIGQLFIEFAVSLAGSVLISGIVALTLSPMMCGRILSQHENRRWPVIDVYLEKVNQYYRFLLSRSFQYTKTIYMVAGGMLLGSIFLFKLLPSEIAPKEDRGLMGIYIPPIPGEDMDMREKTAQKVEAILQDNPFIFSQFRAYLTFMGAWGSYICIPFKNYSQRVLSPTQVMFMLFPGLRSIPSTDAWPDTRDSGLPGIDSTDSSKIVIRISTIGTYKELFETLNKLRQEIEKQNIFDGVSTELELNNPGYSIQLDNIVTSELSVTPSQIAQTVQIFFSGVPYLTFQKDGILYPITLTGTKSPWTLDELYITNSKGKRLSLGTMAKLVPTALPKELEHYNQMRASVLTVTLKKGQTIESAMSALWDLVQFDQPNQFKKEWTGIAKTHLKSSMTMLFLLGMALVFIYAILAVQFENFIDPLIIMLTVPLACFGALLTMYIFGQSVNVYTQIGLVTLIGLITKHGILIVDFANQLLKSGYLLEAAIQEASVLRLRPILMTTAAMVFGHLPLVFASGAGAEARRAIVYVLIGGVALGTLFTLFILPKFYYLVKKFERAQ